MGKYNRLTDEEQSKYLENKRIKVEASCPTNKHMACDATAEYVR